MCADRKEQQEQIDKYREVIPDAYLNIYDKAIKRTSRVAAVKAKCLDCTNWQRAEVRLCAVFSCPLWAYRPYQNVRESKKVSKRTTLKENLL